MLIGEFNRYFARHGKWIFSIILVVIGGSMMFFYGPESDSLFSGNGGNSTRVGTVGDTTIEKHVFRRHVIRLSIFATGYSPQADWDNSTSWDAVAPTVISDLRMIEQAKKEGINRVTDAEVAARIKSMRVFFGENGEFSEETFNTIMENLNGRYRIDKPMMYEIVRDQIVIDRINNRLSRSVTIPDFYIERKSVLENVSAVVRVRSYGASAYMTQVSATDDEIRAHFEANKSTTYVTPEKRRVALVAVPFAAPLPDVQPTDAQIQAYYDQHADDHYTVQKVRAREIFLSFPPNATPEKIEERRQEIEEIASSARAGADFAELAKKHTDFLPFKDKGGDLGYFTLDENPKARAVFDMADGEISLVFENGDGFRVYQRVDAKMEKQNLDDIRDRVRQAVITQARIAQFEAKAREMYEENYTEFDARHILLRTTETTTDAEREEMKKQLRLWRAEALEKGNFEELAKAHSEDNNVNGGTAANGGNLDWANAKRYVPQFSGAALALKDGEISDVVETAYGYHIIQKLGQRMEASFFEVQDDLMRQIEQERQDAGKDAARALADELTRTAHDAVIKQDVKTVDAVELLQSLLDQRPPSEGLVVRRSEPFAANATSMYYVNAKGESTRIQGIKTASVAAAFDKSLTSPVMTTQVGTDRVFVMVLTDIIPQNVPEWSDAMKDRASEDLLRERATTKARDAARAVEAQIRTAMADGATLADAAVALEAPFTLLPPFSLRSGPAGHPDAAQIMDAASKNAAGTLAGAFDSRNGAVIVYVESHMLPDEATIGQSMQFGAQFGRYAFSTATTAAALDALDERYPLSLTEDWQFLVPAADDAAAVTTP